MTAPQDYQLLVPRDWFRVDLTQDRWRPQLKTFVDRHTAGKNVPADVQRNIWVALRNNVEEGLTRGALEFFLKSESDDGRAMPASLLVSLLPTRGALAVPPEEFAQILTEREQRKSGSQAEVSVVELPAGRSVRVLRPTALDLQIHMPGDAGYLMLSFSVPINGVSGPMGRLCDAIAGSLRWVM